MSWYAKQFANGCIAFNPHGRLDEFKEVFDAFAETRQGAALFARKNPDGSVTAYFTPASAEFAIMVQANETDMPPAPEGLMLLAGDPGDLQEARMTREGGRRARRA